MAPTRLSNTSPNIFSEPIFNLENSIGLGNPFIFLLIYLNYFIVLSISSKSIKIKSCKLNCSAIYPSVLLLTADCFKNESVP